MVKNLTLAWGWALGLQCQKKKLRLITDQLQFFFLQCFTLINCSFFTKKKKLLLITYLLLLVFMKFQLRGSPHSRDRPGNFLFRVYGFRELPSNIIACIRVGGSVWRFQIKISQSLRKRFWKQHLENPQVSRLF